MFIQSTRAKLQKQNTSTHPGVRCEAVFGDMLENCIGDFYTDHTRVMCCRMHSIIVLYSMSVVDA